MLANETAHSQLHIVSVNVLNQVQDSLTEIGHICGAVLPPICCLFGCFRGEGSEKSVPSPPTVPLSPQTN